MPSNRAPESRCWQTLLPANWGMRPCLHVCVTRLGLHSHQNLLPGISGILQSQMSPGRAEKNCKAQLCSHCSSLHHFFPSLYRGPRWGGPLWPSSGCTCGDQKVPPRHLLVDSPVPGQACIEALQCWRWQSPNLLSLWVELCPTVYRSWVVTHCYSCLQDPSHNTTVEVGELCFAAVKCTTGCRGPWCIWILQAWVFLVLFLCVNLFSLGYLTSLQLTWAGVQKDPGLLAFLH